MSRFTVDDLFAEEHIVLRLTPDDLRALLLVRYLALEALVTRGVRWPYYFLAHEAIFDRFNDRLLCEVADQSSDAWAKVVEEGWRP